MNLPIKIAILLVLLLPLYACNKFGKKAETLKLIEDAMDFENPVVRNYATTIASKFEGEFNIYQVCEIYNNLRAKWKYVNDPKGKEFFSSASNTIQNNFVGDCDDFAIIMATLIRAIGGDVRISFAYNEKTGHAFTEVFLKEQPKIIRDEIQKYYSRQINKLYGTSSIGKIGFRENKNGGIWLNLDWQSDFPSGEYYDYNKCNIFYQISNKYETISRADNLIKNDKGEHSNYTKQEIAKSFNKLIVLGKDELIDIDPEFLQLDINNDNIDELISYYTVSGGGNATLQRLVVYRNNNGKLQYLSHFDFVNEYWNTYIQDISNGLIKCKKYIYKEDDPRCCPSIEEKVNFKFVIQNNQLQLQISS